MNARAAVADERARIARELHDVVAHSVSVMVIQAGAALHTLNSGRCRHRGSVGLDRDSRASSTRRAAPPARHLAPCRRRPCVDTDARPRPDAGAQEQMREAGLPVEIRVEGQPTTASPRARSGRLPDRAGGTHQHPEARWHRARVVSPSATGHTHWSSRSETMVGQARRLRDGTGHGLVGMRERVALYGGVLDAGRNADGGFAVRARLPLNGNWR